MSQQLAIFAITCLLSILFRFIFFLFKNRDQLQLIILLPECLQSLPHGCISQLVRIAYKTYKCNHPQNEPQKRTSSKLFKTYLHLQMSFSKIGSQMNLLISSAANQRPAIPRTYIFVNKNLFYKFSAYFLISTDTAVNLTAKSQIPVTGSMIVS